MTKIRAGTYRLRFQLGTAWRRARGFCRLVGTSEFDRPLAFDVTESEEGVEYSTFEVTLHPVPLGTATTHTIPNDALQLPP